MNTNQNTQTPAWEMRVDVRNKKSVVATNLSLDEAENFIAVAQIAGLAVVLPTGSLLNAGTQFTMFLRTVRGAKARMTK